MGNTDLWEKLGTTAPEHTKSFKRAGGFSGTAIKPMWSYKRMTEEFGPCGQGWGVGEPTFQVVPGYNSEIMVYCTVSIWWNHPTEQNGPHTVYGVGGDKIVSYVRADDRYNRPERWENDDEAFKKAYTDAVTNALKMIGVGADVHMGMFDDNKYINNREDPLAETPKPKSEPKNDEARKNYDGIKANMRLNKTQQDLMRWWKDADVVAWRSKLPADWQKSLKAEVGEFGDTLPPVATVDDTVNDIQETFPGATVKNERVTSTLEAGE